MADESTNSWVAAVIAVITTAGSIILTLVKIRGNRQKETPTDERSKYVQDSLALEQYYQKQLEIRNRELTEEKQKSANYEREIEEGKKRESDLLRDLNEYKIANTVLEIQVKANHN